MTKGFTLTTRFVITKLVLITVMSMMTFHAMTKELELTGTLMVVNKKADFLTFIDLATRKTVATRATGQGPHEIAVTQDGKWAVVTDYVGGDSLSVYDVQTATKIREISLAQNPRPHGILFLSDQRRVAVSSEGSDSVVIADIHTGKITQVLPTKQEGSHMVALPKDTSKVYTTNMRDDTVTEILIEENRILRQLPMPETPEAITINAAGTELWVGSNKAGLLTLFDVSSGKEIKQWQDYSWPYRIHLTQDEQFAVVPDYKQNTLDIVDVSARERFKRVQFPNGTTPKGVIFYPDDRILFMSAYGKNIVHIVNISNGDKLATLATGDGPDGLGYSPQRVVTSAE